MEEKKTIHILQIVIKNTSTLDFSIPILWGLRKKYPEASISILYTSLNKKQILRNTDFVDSFCIKHNIMQLDLSDFLFIRLSFFIKFIRKIFTSSYSDETDISNVQSLKTNSFFSFMRFLLSRYIKTFEKFFSKIIVNTKSILSEINPDLILFDNRSVTSFSGRNQIYSYFEQEKKPIVLLPHAPHYLEPTSEFCKFDENNDDAMPIYTEHWMPFKFGQPWLVAPNHKAQFINIGYPGLDDSWRDYLYSESNTTKHNLKCLILSRKCLVENQTRPEYFDNSTLDYQEGLEFYVMIKEAIQSADIDIELIIKPHPSSSEPENHKMLSQAGIENYTISYDSFYDLLPRVNIVVSQFSTALSIPIAFGIPTLLLETNLQHFVHEKWPLLQDYYKNLSYYSTKETFNLTFMRMIDELNNEENIQNDKERLRKFFDDRALDKAIRRTEELLKQ